MYSNIKQKDQQVLKQRERQIIVFKWILTKRFGKMWGTVMW
jgi:hypothetical protein